MNYNMYSMIKTFYLLKQKTMAQVQNIRGGVILRGGGTAATSTIIILLRDIGFQRPEIPCYLDYHLIMLMSFLIRW